jgi:hypothetical protein
MLLGLPMGRSDTRTGGDKALCDNANSSPQRRATSECARLRSVCAIGDVLGTLCRVLGKWGLCLAAPALRFLFVQAQRVDGLAPCTTWFSDGQPSGKRALRL